MFKSKKGSLLISRPQPPSFAEIIEDINRANENDVVFEFSESLAEEAVAEDGVVAKSATELTLKDAADDISDDSKSSPDVETVYQKTREFIRLVEELKTAPEKMQALYEHLKLLNTNLQESISSLRQKAEELKSIGPNFNKIESDPKS